MHVGLKIWLAAAVLVVVAVGIFYKCREVKQMIDLTATDPELAKLWDNFAIQGVKQNGNLDAKTKYLVILAGNVAAGGHGTYQAVLEDALGNGVTSEEVKEVLYQAIPYIGMAKVYDFLALTNQVLRAKGIKLPLPEQSTVTNTTRLEKGLALQKEIFGPQIDAMRANAPEELKHIQDYLSANCFGDYYTRKGIDLKSRELLTFALLVSLGGADSQVRSHVQGNLNMGNNRQVLIDTVTQLLPYIGYPRSLNAIVAINEITSKQ